MSCLYTGTLCDPNGNPVLITGILNEVTGAVSNLHYTNLDGSPFSGLISTLVSCSGTVTGGGGDEEVGEGNALPTDNSVYELFRLEGHSTLPNALYWWSEEANQWVQV